MSGVTSMDQNGAINLEFADLHPFHPWVNFAEGVLSTKTQEMITRARAHFCTGQFNRINERVDTVYLYLDTVEHCVHARLVDSANNCEDIRWRIFYSSTSNAEPTGAQSISVWHADDIGSAWLLLGALLHHIAGLDAIRLGFHSLPAEVFEDINLTSWLNRSIARCLEASSSPLPTVLDVCIIPRGEKFECGLFANSYARTHDSALVVPLDLMTPSAIGEDGSARFAASWSCVAVAARAIQQHSWAKVRLLLIDSLDAYNSSQFSWGGRTHRRLG